MIKEFEVRALFGKLSAKYVFNSDLNIFTGKNGCGKTSILKLMYYMLSGNIYQIFSELTFEYAKMTFANGEYLELKSDGTFFSFRHNDAGKPIILGHERSEKMPRLKQIPEQKSIFFPTFRRMEGGFTTNENESIKSALKSVEDNLSDSMEDQKFVATISTNDIIFLLSNKYADISERIRILESDQSKKILESVSSSTNREKDALTDIRNTVEEIEQKKNDILRPFTVLSETIDKIFDSKSISISDTLHLGKAKEAIISDKLSAGEKQILSFLCYNFFYDNRVFFIDEPEISLHPDWQRILFPTLLRQKKNNQFIIATHSPFIYSKFPDKEIIISPEKGGE